MPADDHSNNLHISLGGNPLFFKGKFINILTAY